MDSFNKVGERRSLMKIEDTKTLLNALDGKTAHRLEVTLNWTN